MLVLSLIYAAVEAGSNLAMWTYLVGVLLPPVIAIVQQPRWPSGLRALMTVVACAIVGGVTSWLEQGELDFNGDLLGSILRVMIAAWASYLAFWKTTGVAPALELWSSRPLETRMATKNRGREAR